jgi:hypothetical protein
MIYVEPFSLEKVFERLGMEIAKMLTRTWQKYCIILKEKLFMRHLTVKKGYRFFQSLAGMSLTKLSLVVNNLIIPRQGEFG